MLPSDMTIHNRYRIIYVVDERPESTVYRGRDEQSGRLVLVAALGNQGESSNDVALLAGQDVERALRARGGPLPEHTTLAQARRMLDALEYLHQQKPALHLGDPLAGD